MTIQLTPKLNLTFQVTLTEEEARAFNTLSIYGVDEFINAFYKSLGKHYMEPHEKGLRSFLEKGKQCSGKFHIIDEMKEKFKELQGEPKPKEHPVFDNISMIKLFQDQYPFFDVLVDAKRTGKPVDFYFSGDIKVNKIITDLTYNSEKAVWGVVAREEDTSFGSFYELRKIELMKLSTEDTTFSNFAYVTEKYSFGAKLVKSVEAEQMVRVYVVKGDQTLIHGGQLRAIKYCPLRGTWFVILRYSERHDADIDLNMVKGFEVIPKPLEEQASINQCPSEWNASFTRAYHKEVKNLSDETLSDIIDCVINKKTAAFTYKNYKGETARRVVKCNGIYRGKNGYHEGQQWFLNALCLDRNEYRDFAMLDMSEWEGEQVMSQDIKLPLESNQSSVAK